MPVRRLIINQSCLLVLEDITAWSGIGTESSLLGYRAHCLLPVVVWAHWDVVVATHQGLGLLAQPGCQSGGCWMLALVPRLQHVDRSPPVLLHFRVIGVYSIWCYCSECQNSAWFLCQFLRSYEALTGGGNKCRRERYNLMISMVQGRKQV